MKIQFIFFLAIMLFGCSTKKNFVLLPIEEPYDVIIVPGYPHQGENWDDVMKIRVYWSKYLFDKGYTKNIIYSGGAVYTPYTESITMSLYANKLGINSQHIFLESNAEHSTENVYYSYQIAKKEGFKKIAVASDPFQSKNLIPFIKKYNLPIDLLPINYDTLSAMKKPEPVVNLSTALDEEFISIKEKEGFFKRLGGTFGRHILWHREDLIKKRHIKKFTRKNRIIN